MNEKMSRNVARMPGLTTLIEDHNSIVREMKAGFLTYREYYDWIIRAASLSLGKWPRKEDNIFEYKYVMSMIIAESEDYDKEMSEYLIRILTFVLLDIFQEAQSTIIPKMVEEDTTDRIQRRKMEGIQ